MTAQATLAYSQRGSQLLTGSRYSYRQVFNISDLDPDDDPALAQGLPAIYDRDTHTVAYDQNGQPIQATIICYCLTAELHPENESIAKVTADWKVDPLSMPIEVSYFTSHKQMACRKQIDAASPHKRFPNAECTGPTDGNPSQWITNTAGDWYNPPLTYDKPLVRIEIVRRYANADWQQSTITNYAKHKNSKAFYIAYNDGNGDRIDLDSLPAGTVFCSDIRAPEVIEPYYHKQATFCFEIDADNWMKRVPNIGPRAIPTGLSADDPNFGKPVIPLGPNGMYFSGLVLLDPTGHQLQPTVDKDGNQQWDVVINEFDVIEEADFNMLCLFDPNGHPL